MGPEPVGVAVALAWVAVIATARASRRHRRRPWALEQQIVYLVVAALAAVALALRLGAAHTTGRLCMNAASVVRTSGVAKRYGATTALHPDST